MAERRNEEIRVRMSRSERRLLQRAADHEVRSLSNFVLAASLRYVREMMPSIKTRGRPKKKAEPKEVKVGDRALDI